MLARLRLHNTHVTDSELINLLCLDVRTFYNDAVREATGGFGDSAGSPTRAPRPGRLDVRVAVAPTGFLNQGS